MDSVLTDSQLLIFASYNRNKLVEYKELLQGLPVIVRGLFDFENAPLFEETGAHLSDNARIKAQTATEKYASAAFSDDSGLEVHVLDGEPGVYSKRYAGENASDADNIRKLLDCLRDVPLDQRCARFRTVICLTVPSQTMEIQDYYFEGGLEGFITTEPRGHGGFGYDSIFYVPELDMTLAEADLHLKNLVSHRRKAFDQMKRFLDEHLPFELSLKN